MHQFWRLSEAWPENLGLACTDDGLLLGHTPLIERRDARFVVRERGEIERLLKHAFSQRVGVERLMPGLATVASALNANDPCLARIAAVHLKIPDLPSLGAREQMEAEDWLIKSADWNPDLHPRTGTPPNPGWFAPTGGSDRESSSTQTAQNDNPTLRSDASSVPSDDRVRLPPDKRIDELGDFLEWLANANPEDEKAIRAEIKRYYYDVGDTIGGNALNAALSEALEPGIDQQTRQDILNGIAPYANADPAEVAQFRNLTVGGILAFPVPSPIAVAVDTPSEVWKLGWAARGNYFNEVLGANLPKAFETIDIFDSGAATSIKSIDLTAATYQDTARLTSTLNRYLDSLVEYEGSKLGATIVKGSDITSRTLSIVIPKGTITSAQGAAIAVAKMRAETLGVSLTVTPF